MDEFTKNIQEEINELSSRLSMLNLFLDRGFRSLQKGDGAIHISIDPKGKEILCKRDMSGMKETFRMPDCRLCIKNLQKIRR